MDDRPLYYRFSWHPESGVDLAHDEGDPLRIRYLPDLEDGEQLGYAHRRDPGWRITDLDMKPIDPHIRQEVERAIRSREHDRSVTATWQLKEATLRYGSFI